MEKISKKDYLKYAIDNKYILKLDWVISVLSIILEDTAYIKIGLGNERIAVVDGKEFIIEDVNGDEAVFSPLDKLTVGIGYIPNIFEEVNTSVGRILLNYVLLCHNFGGKIPFQNKVFKVGDIEDDYIAKLLKDDVENDTKYISVDEYVSFIDSAVYLENWADVVSTSSTEKSILPPPGIKQYRDKLIKEAVEKHGPKALEDYAIIVEIENKLKAYDRDYLKDDPSFGKLLDGKILNNSRKKLFLMTGAAKSFKDHNTAELLDSPLADGWDDRPEKLTEQFNAIRHGSYARGKETFKGGLTAKILLRATSSMLIEKTDCKTKEYKTWLVTKNNAKSLIGRYILVVDKPTLLEDEAAVNKYIGKNVKLRSPMYCLAKGENICPICSGTGLSDNENSIPLLITSIGEVMLKSSLKKVHNNSVNTTKLDLKEAIR